jgi:SAM-dependent methyltransferase
VSTVTPSPDAAPPAASGPMQITGERTVPGVEHENYWFRRHEVVYEWLLPYVGDAAVLEAGAGEGYGAALMATTARTVVALDYDAYATGHAARAYPQVPVLRGNLVRLPFTDACFDAVVSLQTVEHLWDQDTFVRECVRVLRPGGRFVVSTPNRLTFPPGNIYHERELTAAELTDLLAPHGEVESLLGLAHGPRLRAWEQEHGDLVAAQISGDHTGWSPRLADVVASVTTGDFRLGEPDDACLDLVSVVRA